jgi:hypothetical protein
MGLVRQGLVERERAARLLGGSTPSFVVADAEKMLRKC